MKAVVLGIDALEFDRVESLNLQALKQSEYGKVEVPINENVGKPHTDQVWPSFLKGETVPGQVSTKEKNSIMRFLQKMPSLFPLRPYIRKVFKVNWDLEPMDIPGKTLLDHTQSKEINAPGYDSYLRECKKVIHKYYDEKIGLQDFKEFVKERFKKDLSLMETSLEEFKTDESNLFFFYTWVLDGLQYVFYKDKKLLRNFYERLNKKVEQVSR